MANISKWFGYPIYITAIKNFEKINKKIIPIISESITPTNSQYSRTTDIKAKEKYLIDPEDYKKMINYEFDKFGQTQALWETYYLSGARPSEIVQMTLDDVKKDKEGIITIIIKSSKSQPRKIPLPETPYKLLEYIEQHPRKNDPKAYLWFSLKRPSHNKPIVEHSIRLRYSQMKKQLAKK